VVGSAVRHQALLALAVGLTPKPYLRACTRISLTVRKTLTGGMAASLAARISATKLKMSAAAEVVAESGHDGPIKSTPGYLSLRSLEPLEQVSAITATARSRSNAGAAAPAT
jgi:hypothetical protein